MSVVDKEKEMWENVQETLREQRYPVTRTDYTMPQAGLPAWQDSSPYPAVQSLKELVMNSVHIETSGDPVITAWTAQPGGSKDILVGYQSLVDYLLHDADSHKLELQSALIYPLFVHCYFSLIASNAADSAQELYVSTSKSVISQCSSPEELQQLLTLTTASNLYSSSLVEKYRSGKYFTRLSEPAFTMLMTFLQAHPTTALLNILNKHFNIEVFGSLTQPSTEPKAEGKKTCNFIKPKIEILPDEFGLSSFPRPLPLPQPSLPPPPTNEDLTAKHEFQQRLTAASQQLEPSIPSLLLCSVHASKNTWVQCACISSESKEYACGLDDSSVLTSSWLPRATKSEGVVTLRGHRGPVHGVSYEPAGQYILSASEDTTVRLWDTRDSNTCAVYQGHSYPVWDVCFSSVDGYFVTASYDRTARLWNTDRLYPLRIFAGHDDSTDVAQFHPNGNYIATGSKDRTCRLWDVNTGNCVRLFPGSKSPVTMLAFSPFGKQLASATHSGTIILWELGTSRVIRELKGHTRNVTSLAYSCDGTMLASTSEDRTVKLWSIKTVLAPSSNTTSSQGLISSQSTGAVLPLNIHFTHRNCLVAVGVSCNETADTSSTATAGSTNCSTNNNNNITDRYLTATKKSYRKRTKYHY